MERQLKRGVEVVQNKPSNPNLIVEADAKIIFNRLLVADREKDHDVLIRFFADTDKVEIMETKHFESQFRPITSPTQAVFVEQD